MTQKEYRAAVDAVTFSPNFQERTLARLASLKKEKECISMKKPIRTVLIAACLAAALVVTAIAAVLLLSPKDVAQRVGNEALATAFEQYGTAINETRTVGDYTVTFMGKVTGKGLEGVMDEIPVNAPDLTYAVLAVARTDGTAITDSMPDVTVTPLKEGCAPWGVNGWTLSGSSTVFVSDGVAYYLMNCPNSGERSVYLAVYPGTRVMPTAEIFSFDEETGKIAYQPSQEGVLFTIPAD